MKVGSILILFFMKLNSEGSLLTVKDSNALYTVNFK